MPTSLTRPDSTILVIFGAGGDLNSRSLTPALYNLFLDERLPERFAVIGVDHKKWTLDEFRSHLLEGVNKYSRRGKADPKTWGKFASHLTHFISVYPG